MSSDEQNLCTFNSVMSVLIVFIMHSTIPVAGWCPAGLKSWNWPYSSNYLVADSVSQCLDFFAERN